MGGLQGLTYGTARDSHGDWFVSDYKNGKIRKLHENVDGSWTVSTFADYSTDALTIDASDNIWVSNSNFITKISPSAVATNYGVPDGGVLQIVSVGTQLLMMTRNNAWDVINSFNSVTQVTTRVAGMTSTEIDAYVAVHGVQLVDGPAVNGATIHSAGIGYVSPDGSEIYIGGGDERQIRRIVGGVVESLIGTGLWEQSQTRLGAPTSNVNDPYYVAAPTGKNPATGYSWAYSFNFDVSAGAKFKAISQITVAGGSANASTFVSQSVPATMTVGVQYSVTVVFHNSGTSTWTDADNYHLGSQNPQDNFTFGWERAFLSANVVAGANATFTFLVRAPTVAASYNFQTKMVQDGVEWFGALSPNVVVNVIPGGGPVVIPGTILIRL
jgi:hypothetical protein